MLRANAWPALDSRNQQIAFLHDFFHKECRTTLSAPTLGYVFEIQESHVRRVYYNGKTAPRVPHRPLALGPDKDNTDIRLIEAGQGNRDFITLRDVLNFVEAEFGKCSTCGWVRNFLVRNADRGSPKVISPQEKPGLEVPVMFLNNYFALIREYPPSVLLQLLFKIEESDISDWGNSSVSRSYSRVESKIRHFIAL
jgi:hypothetical protein